MCPFARGAALAAMAHYNRTFQSLALPQPYGPPSALVLSKIGVVEEPIFGKPIGITLHLVPCTNSTGLIVAAFQTTEYFSGRRDECDQAERSVSLRLEPPMSSRIPRQRRLLPCHEQREMKTSAQHGCSSSRPATTSIHGFAKTA
ncbi:hypothetical protein VNO77_41451 [Canavalia gladiata]|uniref:Uncharacterized protein n=1 Tax=Canavalia gladiata TaxID=3824 RepID=A0AAN9JZF6_CANGL